MYLVIEEKYERAGRILAGAELCRWCESELGSSDDKAVCSRCCQLQTGAKLPDEEIFGAQTCRGNVSK